MQSGLGLLSVPSSFETHEAAVAFTRSLWDGIDGIGGRGLVGEGSDGMGCDVGGWDVMWWDGIGCDWRERGVG